MIPHWTSHQLQDLPEVGHAFFSRQTGRKTDEWGLDLSSPVHDEEARNPHFDEVERHCRVPLAWTHQVHGTRVLEATTPGRVGEADALYTRQPGLALLIRNADCLPLLMVETRQHLVGALHAGWRGLVRGVIPSFFHELRDLWDPQYTRVVIGPSLGPRMGLGLSLRPSPSTANRVDRVGPGGAGQFSPFGGAAVRSLGYRLSSADRSGCSCIIH